MIPKYQLVRYQHNHKIFPADRWLIKNFFNSTINWFSGKMGNIIYSCESVVADYKENKDKGLTLKYYLATYTCIARDKFNDLQKTGVYKSTGDIIKTNTEQVTTNLSEFLEKKFAPKEYSKDSKP